jgi:5-formyltetrahydrofolate cyclo-ligase
MRRRRSAVSPEEARHAARELAERAVTLPELEGGRGLLVCLSFGDELDTGPLMECLLKEGSELFVPRVERETHGMTLHRYPCRLETLGFGLRQPAPEVPALDPASIDETLDAALLAGLAFDRAGYRLGYGRGYFDRFLVARSFPAFGIGYDFQLVDRLPHEPHDVPLAGVVTDREMYRVDG